MLAVGQCVVQQGLGQSVRGRGAIFAPALATVGGWRGCLGCVAALGRCLVWVGPGAARIGIVPMFDFRSAVARRIYLGAAAVPQRLDSAPRRHSNLID